MTIVANCHIYNPALKKELVHLLTKDGDMYETMCERYSFFSSSDELLNIAKVTCERCKQVCREIVDDYITNLVK